MKRIWKKNLSVILAAALVFSGADYGNLSSVYAQENSAWEESPNDLAGETLSAEDESTSAPEETDVAAEQSNAAEEITNALSEDNTEQRTDAGTELASTEESMTEEIQKVNAVEAENGTLTAATKETGEEELEIETEEEEGIAVNATSGDCGAEGSNLTWSYDSSAKTLTISGTGAMKDYQSDTVSNSAIAPWRTTDCVGLQTVIIGEGVTSIGTYAFEKCNFTSVSIPKSLESIGEKAFSYCTQSGPITIPSDAKLNSIGAWAFEKCDLTNVTIDCPVRVGNDAFAGCGFLEKASIQYADEASVENSTFAGCDRLTTVTLGGDFSKIENLAFQGCYALTTVIIPDGTPSIVDSDGTEKSPFAKCSKLTTIDAANGLGSIGMYAFYNMTLLKSIKLSDKATTIGKNAFENCTTLSSIDIPKNITLIGESAFSGCSGLKSVTFSPRDNQKQLTIGTYAFGWCGIEELEIPDNTTVSTSAFTTNAALKKLVIGNNVTLGQNAFNRQSNLEEIIFEKNVTIDNTAFENCESQYLMKLYKGTPAHTYAENSGKNYKYRVEQVQFTPDPDDKVPRELPVNETTPLQIELFPDTTGSNNDGIATIADKIGWQSSNPDIVSIDSSAPTTAEDKASVTVRALKEGTSTITVNCDGKEASCTIKVMVPAKPVTASPQNGSVIYSNSAENNTVTLACGTSGAVIYYTTDGSAPTKNSQQYKTPITFDGKKSSVTIKAFAAADGYLDSEVSTFTYTVKKKAEGIAINSPNLTMGIGESRSLSVRFTPEGAEAETTPVTWKSSDEAVVSVTPGDSDTTTAQITAKSAGTCTITASCGSFTAACEVTVNETPSVSPVTAEPDSGEVPAGTTVTLRCGTQDADIYYTTDGSEPSAQSTRYEGSITINSDTTIKAVAIKSGYNDSETAVFTYTIKEKIIEITGISLDKDELKLGVDQKGSLTVSFQPENALPQKITWSSDKPSVAQVLADAADDATAEVTALAAGSCVITASCGEFTAQCTVTVTEKECVPAVKAEPGSGAVEAGTKVSLLCDIPDAKIYYTTDNTTPTAQSTLYTTPIAIDKALTIKAFAKKEGYEDSAVSTFEYTIKNEQEIPVTGISLDKDELKLGVEQKGSLTVSFQPENALPEKITWSSDKPSVAQVLADAADDATAEVTALAAGSCVITASCGEFTAQCTVTVTEKECVPAVKAEPGSGAVAAGTKVSLLCDIPDAKIYYTTDNTTPTAQSTLYTTPIAIDKALTIKAFAVKEGYEDSAVSTFEYTIKNEQEIPVTGISLDKNELKLGVDQKGSLTVSFQPENALPEKITWSSDKPSVAQVLADAADDATAEVTALAAGTCVITASCGEFTAQCTVTVTEKECVPAVKAEPGSGAVAAGTKVSLLCDIPDAKIYYTTDNTAPTTQSTLYTTPIAIDKALTIKAFAVKEGYEDSAVSTFDYTIKNEQEIPVTGISLDRTSMEIGLEETGRLTVSFQPADAAPQKITWTSDNTEIAVVAAETDNSASAKITGKKAGKCTVTASCLTFTASCTVTVADEKRVSAVYATPSAKSPVAPGTEVTLYCDTAGAAIYYTLDGTAPTTAGTRYSGPIMLLGDTTIKTYAVKEGCTDSPVSVFEFIVNDVVPDIPDIDPSKEGIWIAAVADQTYTGSAIKPAVYVFDGQKLLTEKTDYTVSYKNNTKPGTGEITITGKGNYTDKKTAEFTITKKDISGKDVIIEDMAYAYNGKIHKTAPTITHNGKKLKLNKDFEVTYGEGGYIEEGRYTLTIKGIGNYEGTADGSISIIGKDKLINKASIAKIPSQQYNKGNEVTLPDALIKVTLNRQTLQKGKDYTVEYANHTNPGKATIIITGIGEYAGTKKAVFSIVRTAVNMTDVTCTNSKSFEEMEFVKGGCTPVPVLTHDGYTLRAGTDYTVSYKNNKKAGAAAKLVVSGKGNFKGKKEISFTVSQKDISKVSMYTPNVPYTGKANKYQSKPVLVDSDGTRLKANTDYTLTFTEGGDALDKRSNPSENAVITVHVKGKGSYCGERTDTYILSGTNFSTAKIQIQNKDYTGKAVTITEEDIKSASIKVAGTTVPLTYGKDFEAVSYSKNVKKGTASVILCGKGEYCGEKTVKFKIVSRNIKSE